VFAIFRVLSTPQARHYFRGGRGRNGWRLLCVYSAAVATDSHVTLGLLGGHRLTD